MKLFGIPIKRLSFTEWTLLVAACVAFWALLQLGDARSPDTLDAAGQLLALVCGSALYVMGVRPLNSWRHLAASAVLISPAALAMMALASGA